MEKKLEMLQKHDNRQVSKYSSISFFYKGTASRDMEIVKEQLHEKSMAYNDSRNRGVVSGLINEP